MRVPWLAPGPARVPADRASSTARAPDTAYAAQATANLKLFAELRSESGTAAVARGATRLPDAQSAARYAKAIGTDHGTRTRTQRRKRGGRKRPRMPQLVAAPFVPPGTLAATPKALAAIAASGPGGLADLTIRGGGNCLIFFTCPKTTFPVPLFSGLNGKRTGSCCPMFWR